MSISDPDADLKARTAEFDGLLQAVGQAITDWAQVEEGLFHIFFRALAAPALGPPACAFIAADNVRAKIAMVDSIIRHSSLTKPLIPQWEELLKRLNKARGNRNDVAHRKAAILQIGKGKPRAALLTYNHDFRPSLKGEPHRMSYITLDRVKELAIEFRTLGRDLASFSASIPLPPKRQ